MQVGQIRAQVPFGSPSRAMACDMEILLKRVFTNDADFADVQNEGIVGDIVKALLRAGIRNPKRFGFLMFRRSWGSRENL